MSFSVSSGTAALSLLQSLTASSGGTDLASVLSRGAAPGGGDPVVGLVQAERNQTKEIARQQKDPETKRDVDRFLAVANKAPDLKTLLADPIARKVFLTANGLGDQTDYAALAVRALGSDTTKSGSLAAKLADTRWLKTAKTYDFANKGLTVLKNTGALNAIASGYAEVQWRQSLDKATPGLSAALDFRGRAATVTKVDDILGDKNLREVVTVALGIPKQIAFQPLQTQEKAITDRLDLAKLKDPKFVEQFARRYLIQNGINSQTDQTQSTGLLA